MNCAILAIQNSCEHSDVVYQPQAKPRKMLIVATDEETRYFLGSFLERTAFPAARVDSGQQCLEAAARERFGLIIARVPLPDMSVSALATGLNQRFSLNDQSPILMLAEGPQYEAALGYQADRMQVVDVGNPATNVERLAVAALGIAARTSARLDVELELEGSAQNDRRHCKTRDISSSGMLLDGTDLLPLGTEFAFNFTLPERFTPIHGRAEVVRHSDIRENVNPGMGVRFVSFPEGAEEAISSFVNLSRPISF